MFHTVVILSIAAASLACAPKNVTTKTGGKTTRDVDQAEVILVTKANFNPKMNPIYMEAIRSAIDQHAYERGIINNHDLVQEESKDIGGKFGVVLTVIDADCDELKDFASSAKEMSLLVEHTIVNCGGKPTTL
ncbi:hypothetical protein TELCIR_14604 [Teladorsagia circumcincta]|uniref:Uncharacterized protein n=1 Tax=Teladorsagia circumcincta TaxID=45464 RepID=A0A2G9U246_TELCI|nr:hypothetical protein TELCIR_14604 [Teladorsagia circumcincta]